MKWARVYQWNIWCLFTYLLRIASVFIWINISSRKYSAQSNEFTKYIKIIIIINVGTCTTYAFSFVFFFLSFRFFFYLLFFFLVYACHDHKIRMGKYMRACTINSKILYIVDAFIGVVDVVVTVSWLSIVLHSQNKQWATKATTTTTTTPRTTMTNWCAVITAGTY